MKSPRCANCGGPNNREPAIYCSECNSLLVKELSRKTTTLGPDTLGRILRLKDSIREAEAEIDRLLGLTLKGGLTNWERIKG
jgi:hypothetical protein